MHTPIALHAEYSQVIACSRCSVVGDRHLLRDDSENVPQPGYVGRNYEQWRVLLAGQNPGTPKTLAVQDLPYTAALRALRDEPTPERYAALVSVLEGFIPQWPVHGNYFPLAECGLTLNDIARTATSCGAKLRTTERPLAQPSNSASQLTLLGGSSSLLRAL